MLKKLFLCIWVCVCFWGCYEARGKRFNFMFYEWFIPSCFCIVNKCTVMCNLKCVRKIISWWNYQSCMTSRVQAFYYGLRSWTSETHTVLSVDLCMAPFLCDLTEIHLLSNTPSRAAYHSQCIINTVISQTKYQFIIEATPPDIHLGLVPITDMIKYYDALMFCNI